MNLENTLKLDRCPYCSINKPNLSVITGFQTTNDSSGYNNGRNWKVYSCARCGGAVIACSTTTSDEVKEVYPKTQSVNEILPGKVKAFLQQAIDSVFAPAGSVMLCASAVDAMLKEKGFVNGSLYSRLKQGSKDGVLTKEMETWAHQVRLDANDQRHSDAEVQLPNIEQAKQAIEFTQTLAEFLFVLPSKVTRGIEATSNPNNKE